MMKKRSDPTVYLRTLRRSKGGSRADLDAQMMETLRLVADGVVHVDDLISRLDIAPGRALRLFDQLESMGYLERRYTEGGRDRVELTKTGHTVLSVRGKF